MYHKYDTPYQYTTKLSSAADHVNADIIEAVKKYGSIEKKLTYENIREIANEFFKSQFGSLENIKTEDFVIKNELDQYSIPVRLYNEDSNSKQLIVFIHGGGWMQGNLDTHDYLCRKMAKILDVKLIAVDYRLAPEYKFPTALDDVHCVYKWCADSVLNNNKFENIEQIFVSGDSSGGNLSAALNLKLNQDKYAGHMPDGLILMYPALSSNIASTSYGTFKNMPVLTAANTVFFMKQYIDKDLSDPTISGNELIFPINGDTYPPTFIVAAECDVLLDEQLELFDKLQKKKILSQLFIEKGSVHGFMTYGRWFEESVTEVLQEVKKWINELFIHK